jgi:putative membrane protein
MMHWDDGGMDWLDWLFGSAMMLAFWALVVIAVIAVIQMGRFSSRSEQGTPEQLLDERLARGEIDIEEYARRRDLQLPWHPQQFPRISCNRPRRVLDSGPFPQSYIRVRPQAGVPSAGSGRLRLAVGFTAGRVYGI